MTPQQRGLLSALSINSRPPEFHPARSALLPWGTSVTRDGTQCWFTARPHCSDREPASTGDGKWRRPYHMPALRTEPSGSRSEVNV